MVATASPTGRDETAMDGSTAAHSARGHQQDLQGRCRRGDAGAVGRHGRHRPRRVRLGLRPSGCGKSTFLAILALLDSPTTGRYWLNGRAVDRLSPAERARVRNVDIGLIFQSFNLIGDMTVYENVEYPLTLRGASASERAGTRRAALDRVGLTGRAKQRPGSALRRSSAARRRSPARSPAGPRSCSPTSRPATSIRRAATR